MKIIRRIFTCVFALCALISVAALTAQENQKPEEVVKTFYQLLDEGKPKEAAALFSTAHISDDDAKKSGLARLAAGKLSNIASKINEYGGLDTVEVTSSKISGNGNRAIVKAKPTLMKPVEGFEDDTFQMKKEEGVWKIYDYE